MLVNTDFRLRVVVDTGAATWMPSPEPGVERVMLERDGGELARATSVVRYAAGSAFPPHVHDRGEELVVLDGELRDEHGTFPVGTYVCDPWGTRHSPFSLTGCLLLVKLRQLAPECRAPIVVHDAFARTRLSPGEAERVLVLREGPGERVALVRWAAGHARGAEAYPYGAETFIVEGELEDELGAYARGTWIREPPGTTRRPQTASGCLLWIVRRTR